QIANQTMHESEITQLRLRPSTPPYTVRLAKLTKTLIKEKLLTSITAIKLLIREQSF
ncbi:4708_t:CDS:1, partial [Funneliformis caledonium]